MFLIKYCTKPFETCICVQDIWVLDGLNTAGIETELNSDQFQKAAVPVSQDVYVSLPELTGVKCMREPGRWLL